MWQRRSAGGIVYGLSNALKERITFVNGAVEQSNFHDYPVLRMGEVPHIDCEVIQSTRAPTGSGEAGTIGIMPALANAIAARTGQRCVICRLHPKGCGQHYPADSELVG